MLGLVAFAAASDYDLVVPRGWDYLKNSKTLVVYSPNGAFKQGDRITRVIAGGADGTGVRVSVGWPSANSVELAKEGTANGYAGQIILSADSTGSSGLAASIVPAGQGATRAPDDGLTHAIPWMWILGGAGLIVLLAGAATLFRKSSAPVAPMRFSGRKGIEEGVREIRTKIDEIQEEQKQLVRKPPVLRSFRKQIDGFEHRLKDIETTNLETAQQLASVAGILTKLDERLTNIAQHSVSASGDSKKAIELVNKLSTEQTKRSATLEEKIQHIASTQDGFSSITRDVAKTIDAVSNVASRIDGLAAQNLAHENKLQSTIAGIETTRKEIASTRQDIDATRKDIEKLDGKLRSGSETADATRKQLDKLESRLATSAESAEATKQGIGELAAALHATDQKLAGLEIQATASAQRDGDAKNSIVEVAKSAEFLEKGLLRLDARVDELAKSNEALHLNLQKSAEALQLNLQEISGLVSNSEGALHANLHGLAHELGTLRNEVGTLPVAMSSLGERVGSLDARLAPISERGDKLAEGFVGLQSRFEDAALSLAKQVQTLESRLEEIKTEGSKLANLPEMVHGNAAEMAAHVRSAETGLKSLGEELAKLQEALLSDNKQSDVVAQEITQRLEAWENSLANVASKVEDLRAPAAEEEDEDLEEDVAKQPKKSKKAAKREAAKARAEAEEAQARARAEAQQAEARARAEVEEARAKAESESRAKAERARAEADKARTAEGDAKAKAEEAARAEAKARIEAEAIAKSAGKKPDLKLVESEPKTEVAAAAPPKLVLQENKETVEAAQEKPAPKQASAQAASQNADQSSQNEEDINFEEDEEDGLVLSRSKAGRWTELAGSSERLWSVKLPINKPLPAVKGPIRPLTPIETPSIDAGVGALICTGQGAAYVHGSQLHCFWPGTETKSVALQSPVPNDMWRLMLFGGYIYCAEERQVEIIHTSTWTKHAFFTGDYLNQAHTESNWVGLMAWGDQLAVDFRDTLGNHVNSPRELEASAAEQSYFAASGNSAFVGTRGGSIFRVDPAGSVQLARPSDEDKLLSISITKAGILAMIQGSAGIEARLISRDGHLIKSSELGCQVMAHAPVIVSDRFYIFDDCQSELLTVSLRNLQVTSRMTLDSTLGVSRIVGLACGKNHYLSIMGTDDRGVCTRAFVLDIKTGQEMTLCPINHPRAEMVAGDGHLVIATSSAYQNTIQVFNPFEAVDLKQKKAA